MQAQYISKLVVQLKARGVVFENGLSDAEVERAERRYDFVFPTDLRRLLQYALPVSSGFPDWRNFEDAALAERFGWAADGICFDIARSGFWLNEWGAKPGDADAACRLARGEIAKAPVLIPIYSHRFMPSEPETEGNPVLSVYQTDIIYYGYDLASYFAAEFGVQTPEQAASEPRAVRFWDNFLA